MKNKKKFILIIIIFFLCTQQAKTMIGEEFSPNIPLSDLIEEIKKETLHIAFSTQEKIQDQLDALNIKEGEDYNLDSEIFKSTFKSIISDIWVALILSAQIKYLNKESFYSREVEEYKSTLISSAKDIIQKHAIDFAKFIKEVLQIRKQLEQKSSINLEEDHEYLEKLKNLFQNRIILILNITEKLLIEKFNYTSDQAIELISKRIKPGIGGSMEELSNYISRLFLDYYTLLWKYDLPLRNAILENPERLKGRNLFDGSVDSILNVFESYIQYIYLPKVSFPYKKPISEEQKHEIQAKIEEKTRIGTLGEVETPPTLSIDEIRQKISNIILKKAQEIEEKKAARLRETRSLTLPDKDAIKMTLENFFKHRIPQVNSLPTSLIQLRNKLTELKNKMQLLQTKLEMLKDRL